VVLDLGQSGLPGEGVLVRLQELPTNPPVIVLTAKATVADEVANLEAGADDLPRQAVQFSTMETR
jgi:DNA-binding response OmpR family regulator